jgi:hypothetical protein
VLLCLGINLAILAGIAVRRPAYLHDARLSNNPDAWHHVLLGRNVLLTGNYSRCEAPPYFPDMLRPPVYPLFAGGLDLLGGAAAIYLAQAMLQAGSCLLLYQLVRRPFGDRAAFCASLFLAADLMVAVYNFEAMSEPLFTFLVLAAAVSVCPLLGSADLMVPGAARRLVGGGLLLGLAILTRPVGLYLPLIFAVALGAVGLWRRRLSATVGGVAAFLLPLVLLVGAWIIRNQAVFGLPRLSTVDIVVQDYFLGAGAYQLHDQVSLEEAQARISSEYNLPPSVIVQNPWRSEQNVAEMDAALRRARSGILAKYPRELVLAAACGVAKATFSHNVEELASLLALTWEPPGTGALLHGQADAFGRLRQDGPVLGGALAWQTLHTLLGLTLAAAGLVASLRRPETRSTALLLLALLAYCYLTVALFGMEAFYRCRIPALPFLYAFAGLGLARLTAAGRVHHPEGAR